MTQHSRLSDAPATGSIFPTGFPYSIKGVPCPRAESCNPLTAVRGNILTLVGASEIALGADCWR
ncbi:hypothetical protein ACKS0A_06136 [Histoplasma ohiense]